MPYNTLFTLITRILHTVAIKCIMQRIEFSEYRKIKVMHKNKKTRNIT